MGFSQNQEAFENRWQKFNKYVPCIKERFWLY